MDFSQLEIGCRLRPAHCGQRVLEQMTSQSRHSRASPMGITPGIGSPSPVGVASNKRRVILARGIQAESSTFGADPENHAKSGPMSPDVPYRPPLAGTFLPVLARRLLPSFVCNHPHPALPPERGDHSPPRQDAPPHCLQDLLFAGACGQGQWAPERVQRKDIMMRRAWRRARAAIAQSLPTVHTLHSARRRRPVGHTLGQAAQSWWQIPDHPMREVVGIAILHHEREGAGGRWHAGPAQGR